MFWLRMAIRQIRVNRGFSLFFILNLAVGLAGFIAVQSFGHSIERHLTRNLKDILTADLVVSAASPLTPEEEKIVEKEVGPGAKTARLVAFYTMIRPDKAPPRMVRIMAVGKNYPLYGKFATEQSTRPQDLQEAPRLFMTRDTAASLGLRTEASRNAPLHIGKQTFNILDFFSEDPDKTLTSLDLAPKVYMGIEQLQDTGLVQFGSRIRYVRFFAFAQGTDVPKLTHSLQTALFDASHGSPRVHVFDTRDANRQLGRLTRTFAGYMGMVGIVALFLSGMSAAYLFRSVVEDRQHQMAVLLSCGAVRREAYVLISLELIILGTIAALLALVAAAGLLPAFPWLLRGLVPQGLVPALSPSTGLTALGLGAGGSLVFCLPVFMRLFRIRPLYLLRNMGGFRQLPGEVGRTRAVLTGLVSVLPGLAAFFGLAAAIAERPWDGIVFAAGFILASGLLFIGGLIAFKAFGLLAAQSRIPLAFPVKMALRNLFRNRFASLASFVSIAMGIFLIALVPQIQRGIESEIIRPTGLKLPVFFLVDIQEAQKEPLTRFMQTHPGELSHISPMVQGRITSVNGNPFFDRPPAPGTEGRPGGRRLEFIFSYRNTLSDSESIVEGTPLPATPWNFENDTPFGLSVAVSFARRHNLAIGDTLGFDVQGIPLTGKVMNLRKVRWNSFQPNFFLLFQDGVLNDAPKTYLGALSNVPVSRRNDLKNALWDAFPNISVIDVTKTAATILSVTDRLSLSIRFMALLAIAAGLVAIFSIARDQARKNRSQINLLKVLGCNFTTLRTISLVEFGLVGFLSGLFALCLSVVSSRGIAAYFFDDLWDLDLFYLLTILLLATAVCMVTGLFAARRVMKERPSILLRT